MARGDTESLGLTESLQDHLMVWGEQCPRWDEAVRDGIGQQLLGTTSDLEQLVPGESVSATHRSRLNNSGYSGKAGLAPSVELVEVLLDDSQRKIVISLKPQDETKPLNVLAGIGAITGRSPTGLDKVTVFKKTEFRGRKVGKLPRQSLEDLTDR